MSFTSHRVEQLITNLDRIATVLEEIRDRLPEPEPKQPPLTGEAALPRWSTKKDRPYNYFDF